MPRRRKGGSALMALARRRKLKAAKDKEGKMDAMVIKPALSRLRTGAVSKRKKGSQTLMDLAKRRKKPAAKRPASSQPSKFGARIPVESRSPATKAQQPKAKRKTRTPAKRAADKKKLQAEMKKTRKESTHMRYGSEYKIPGLSKKDREGMEESVKFGAGGAGKIAAAGVGAGALKLYQMYKAKRAADLAKSARRGSGLGGGKPPAPKPKPKPKPRKKKSKAQIKRDSMRGGSQWR